MTGPTRSQFWLPLTLTPSGVNTSSCSTNATPRSGSARRFHMRTGTRDGDGERETPMTAKTTWLRKIE